MTLVLASASLTRRRMLDSAGVSFEVDVPQIDEDAVKASLRNDGMVARDLADALAELKATRVSRTRPSDIVLGCDQTLELDDGSMLDKPGNDLAAHLRILSGRAHRLHAACVAVENGQPIWRHVDTVRMTVRALSEDFIADYVRKNASDVANCLGGYQIEAAGAQLFSKVEGCHFTVLGLPLISLLDWLRVRGLMTS